MLSKHFSIVACGLTLGLGGCAAAPLAQMAVTHMAAPQAGPGGGVPQGMADAAHKWTGTLNAGGQPVAGTAPQPVAGTAPQPVAGTAPLPIAGTAQVTPVAATAPAAMPSFSDISHGISGSFHKLIGDGADTQTLVTGSPAK